MSHTPESFWQLIRDIKLRVFKDCHSQADVEERSELYVHELRKSGIRVKERGAIEYLRDDDGKEFVTTDGWWLSEEDPTESLPS